MEEGVTIGVSITGLVSCSPMATMEFGQIDGHFTFGQIDTQDKKFSFCLLSNSCTPEPKLNQSIYA